MRISDWSSDVCSSDLLAALAHQADLVELLARKAVAAHAALDDRRQQAERAEVDEHREEVAAEEDGEEAPLWWLLGHVGAAGEHRGRGDAALAQQGNEQDEGGEEGGAVEAAQRPGTGLRLLAQGVRETGGAEGEIGSPVCRERVSK